MLSLQEVLDIAKNAYEAVNIYRSTIPTSPQNLVSDIPGQRRIWAEFFATNTEGVPVVSFAHLPVPNFASWLVLSPDLAIALSEGQMQQWAAGNNPLDRLPAEVQGVRAILHELGHIRVTPQVLRKLPRPGRPTTPTTLPEEERAWVFAIIVLALVLGDCCDGNELADYIPRRPI